MIALLKRLAARIDDMSLRERALLLGAASLIVIVLAYVTAIDPTLTRQKTLVEQLKRDQTQLASVRGELEKLVRERGSAEQLPEQQAVRELERRLAEVERTLARKQREFVGPERLQTLLRDLLGRGKAVRLESLSLLPGTPVQEAAPAGEQSGVPALYRHGVQVTLRGAYFDLVQYLHELEKLPARLLWGRVELLADPYPEVKLTLSVYTVTAQRTLLVPVSSRKAD